MCHSKQVPHSVSRERKSIFARQIAAQRVTEGPASSVTGIHPAAVQKNDSGMETDQHHSTDDRELVSVSLLFLAKFPLFCSYCYCLFCFQLLLQGHGWCLDRGFWAPIVEKRPRGSTERTWPSSRACLRLRFYRSRRNYYLSSVGYFIKLSCHLMVLLTHLELNFHTDVFFNIWYTRQDLLCVLSSLVKGSAPLYVDTSAYITRLFLLPRPKAGEVY